MLEKVNERVITLVDVLYQNQTTVSNNKDNRYLQKGYPYLITELRKYSDEEFKLAYYETINRINQIVSKQIIMFNQLYNILEDQKKL